MTEFEIKGDQLVLVCDHSMTEWTPVTKFLNGSYEYARQCEKCDHIEFMVGKND